VSDSVTLSVPGIHCEHCARSIREEVSVIEGVAGVEVDLEAKRVTVHGTALSDDEIRAAIAEAGYEAE
jgi:copper ion binding protein